MSRSLTHFLVFMGVVATVGAATTAVVLVSSDNDEAEAHGSTQVPASRVYSCRFEAPDNPMCAQASSANPQAIYDWMEVNIGDADGRHQALIPDGELCSAGREKYAAFDEPGEWPVTHLEPNSGGQYDVVYTNTAPHATAYYRFMITKPGFDARTDTLSWDDLDVVYESGELAASGENHFSLDLPERQEPAILYVIWQRSDSPEAFYACSDVTIGSNGGAGTTPPPATEAPDPGEGEASHDGADHEGANHGGSYGGAGSDTSGHEADDASSVPPPSDGEASSSSPVESPTTTEGIEASETVTADWDSGYCSEIQVDNTTSSTVSWEVDYQPRGTVDTVWSAEGEGPFTGASWNASLPAGQSTTFGMCVTKD